MATCLGHQSYKHKIVNPNHDSTFHFYGFEEKTIEHLFTLCSIIFTPFCFFKAGLGSFQPHTTCVIQNRRYSRRSSHPQKSSLHFNTVQIIHAFHITSSQSHHSKNKNALVIPPWPPKQIILPWSRCYGSMIHSLWGSLSCLALKLRRSHLGETN